MNIQILKPDQFISLNKEVYIKHDQFQKLSENLNDILVLRSGEEPAINIETEMALSPTDLEIEIYLQNNTELRDLALELDLIYIRDREAISYINYCNSY